MNAMNQDKLDQFFRDKLANSKPVMPSEADWASAKAMLNLEKEDDRPLLWWLLFLGLINLILVFSIDSIENVQSKSNLQPIEKQEMASESPIIIDEGLNDNFADKEELSKSTEGERAALEEAKVTSEKLPQLKKTEENNVVGSEAAKLVTISSSIENKSPLVRLDSEQDISEDGIVLTSPLPETVTEHDREVHEEKHELIDPTKVINDHPRMDARFVTEDLVMLDTRTADLAHFYGLEKPQPKGMGSLFDRPKFRQTKYGWSGTLLLNPGSQAGDPVQGIRFGFLAEHYLAKNWLVGTRPSMQITFNETGFSKFEVQTTFSFSAVNETYGLQASSLQFISLPIYLAWTSKKHTIEMGGGVDWLVSARGQVQQVSIENDGVETLNALANGWIDTDQMEQFSSRLFLGYKFAINYRLKAGMTLFYNPTDIYPGFEGRQFQHGRKWYMGMQANYYLN